MIGGSGGEEGGGGEATGGDDGWGSGDDGEMIGDGATRVDTNWLDWILTVSDVDVNAVVEAGGSDVIAGIDEKGRLEVRIGPSDRVLLFSF